MGTEQTSCRHNLNILCIFFSYVSDYIHNCFFNVTSFMNAICYAFVLFYIVVGYAISYKCYKHQTHFPLVCVIG